MTPHVQTRYPLPDLSPYLFLPLLLSPLVFATQQRQSVILDSDLMLVFQSTWDAMPARNWS